MEDLFLPLSLSVAIAIFVVTTHPNMPFANDGNCDPWHYFGRFYISDQIPMLGPTRAGARLPENIIGYIATSLLKNVWADYANFFILFVTANVAVYAAARRLFGVPAAIFAVIFFATQPLVVANFSVTLYAPAVSYSAIAIAFAVAASTMEQGVRRDAALLATGFFFGTAVHAHLYSLSFNFIVAFYCLDWWRRPLLSFLYDALGKWVWLLLGVVLATVFFGLINLVFLHGSFFFFLKQYQDAFTAMVAEYEKPYRGLFGGHGALLIIGAAASISQALWIWRRPLNAPGTRSILTSLVPFAALELAQIGYTIYGGITLQYDYYFVWLIAPLTLVIASMASRIVLSRPAMVGVLGVYLVGCLLADFGRLDLIWESVNSVPPSIIMAILLVVAFLWALKSPNAGTFSVLLLLVGLNATIRPEKIGLPLWETGDYQGMYVRVRAGLAFISHFRFAKPPKFWISDAGQLGESIAYPRAYDQCRVETALPNFLPDTIDPDLRVPDWEKFRAGDDLVMVAPSLQILYFAERRLYDRGLKLKEMGRDLISYRGISYLIVVGQLGRNISNAP